MENKTSLVPSIHTPQIPPTTQWELTYLFQIPLCRGFICLSEAVLAQPALKYSFCFKSDR